MRTIAITNQKGGVGKTTTTVHLGHALALAGQRVLVVDADGQGHCALFLGAPRQPDLGRVLTRTRPHSDDPERAYAPTATFIQTGVRTHLDLIACDPSIAMSEARIQTEAMRELRLATRLQEVGAAYDVALIDVGPKTDLLSTLALLAADGALIVTLPSTPHQSLQDVSARLATLRAEAGRGPQVIGVTATQVDAREGLSRDTLALLQDAGFSDVPSIPRSVAIARATRAGKTVFETAPDSVGAAAYHNLAAWMARRLE